MTGGPRFRGDDRGNGSTAARVVAPPDPAHQGQRGAAAQGQEGVGGGEAVAGGDGGVGRVMSRAPIF